MDAFVDSSFYFCLLRYWCRSWYPSSGCTGIGVYYSWKWSSQSENGRNHYWGEIWQEYILCNRQSERNQVYRWWTDKCRCTWRKQYTDCKSECSRERDGLFSLYPRGNSNRTEPDACSGCIGSVLYCCFGQDAGCCHFGQSCETVQLSTG